MKLNLTYYFILLLAVIGSVIVVPFFLSYGGIGADSISYFRLANDFPKVSYSLFPLGYPMLLKIFNLVFNDFYWSARILNICLILTIALFSLFKNFHFRETVILLCTKIFIFSLFNFISEGLFLTLMYFLFYYLYQYFNNKVWGCKFFIPAGLFLALLFSVRYSALYLFAGFCLFYLIWYYKNLKKINFFKNDLFRFLLVAGCGIMLYALLNYLNFGDFAGEKFRYPPYRGNILVDSFRNILSYANMMNPVLGIKLNSLTHLTLVLEMLLLAINVFFIYFSIKIWRKYFKENNGEFHQLLIIIGFTYATLVFATFYIQGIEELNIRLLLESSFCFFFSLIFIYFNQNYSEKLIFSVALFSIAFNVLVALKSPENFLIRKHKIENKLKETSGKKYFFINSSSLKRISVYHIPLINKDIRYKHQNQQDAYINGNIIMTKNPKIVRILKDTVQNKKKVIYASDLE